MCKTPAGCQIVHRSGSVRMYATGPDLHTLPLLIYPFLFRAELKLLVGGRGWREATLKQKHDLIVVGPQFKKKRNIFITV